MAKDGTSFAPGLILKTSKSLPFCLHDKPESKAPLSLSCERRRIQGTLTEVNENTSVPGCVQAEVTWLPRAAGPARYVPFL